MAALAATFNDSTRPVVAMAMAAACARSSADTPEPSLPKMSTAPRAGKGSAVHPDIAAASLQGTLAELARMIQVGVIRGPAVKWKGELVKLFLKLAA